MPKFKSVPQKPKLDVSVIIAILSHLNVIVSTLEDGEQAIAAAISGNWSTAEADGLEALNNLIELFTGGVLSIPGVDTSQIAAFLQALAQGVQPAPAPTPAA